MLLGCTRLDRDEDFLTFAGGARTSLQRVAALLCAGDPLRAEVAVRTALTRAYLGWPVAGGAGAAGTALRVLVEAVRREGRRAPHPGLPAAAVPSVEQAVLTALATLPVRSRAAVVLRRVERLPVAQVADVLGCLELTAVREAAAGVTRLREELADLVELPAGPRPGADLDALLRGTADRLADPAPDAAVLQADLDRGHRALVLARRRRAETGTAPLPGARTAVPS